MSIYNPNEGNYEARDNVPSPFGIAATNNFSKHFEWAKNELTTIEGRKRDIIKELACRLESDDMPTERIAIEIANQLEGYASPQYVGKCLDDKYKLQSKVREGKKQQGEEEKKICETSSAKICEPHVIIVNNDGTEEKQEKQENLILPVQHISSNFKPDIESKEFAGIVNKLAEKTEQLLNLQSEIKLKDEDIHTLKEENQKLREDLAKVTFKAAIEYMQDPSVLQKRLNEQGKLLLPFTKNTQLEVRGNILPLIVKVKPTTQEVQVILDEEEAKRLIGY